jgi:hypothetical protein
MYLQRQDAFGQVPMSYGSFAEPLGSFAPEVEQFLKQVRKRPRDFRKLLLMVTFHPDLISSQLQVPIGGRPTYLIDASLFYNLQPPVDFLDALRRIRDDFQKQDAQFNQQIEAELQLRNEMMTTAGESARRLGPATLNPILLDALLGYNFSLFHFQVGLAAAPKILPASLVQRITNSEASEAHLTNLGRWLRRYGEVLQTKNSTFKALVERERKRRQQKAKRP